MRKLDRTHDVTARSWLATANVAGSDFPIQNLPFGVFKRSARDEPARGGVAIGDQILDLAALSETTCLRGLARDAVRACAAPVLNRFLAMGPPAWRALRHGLFDLLNVESVEWATVRDCLVPQQSVDHALPTDIGDYTDFYTSIHHARTISRLLSDAMGEVPRNFRWVPTAYHGRASSIGVSGQSFRRPRGQILRVGATSPEYCPSERLDYELELGIHIGAGNAQGEPIALSQAEDHVFGISLLNDWSARDIQSWEMVPLGPFHAKNFATTVSPWIVTLDALTPYRLPWTRAVDEPQPLPYLDGEAHRATGAFDIELEVLIETEHMRRDGSPSHRLSQSNFSDHYWSIAQMVTHHAAGGCNFRPGDLLGSGTISGADAQQAGALIELTLAGRQPVLLPSGERRSFLADGDAIVMRAWCQRVGFARIGLGTARGLVLPAIESTTEEHA